MCVCVCVWWRATGSKVYLVPLQDIHNMLTISSSLLEEAKYLKEDARWAYRACLSKPCV